MMSKIRIKSKQEMDRMRETCRLAAEILQRAGELVKPGITTDEINTFVHEYTIKNGAIPSPLNYHGFPKSVCTSVNEVVTHGIPGPYVLKEGDIINIDVTCQLNGYHGDTSKTYLVGNVTPVARRLVHTCLRALEEAILVVSRPGTSFPDIGQVIQAVASEEGFSVVRDYCGHGIGRGFHEAPLVLHYRNEGKPIRFQEGMAFTIEPMINQGSWQTKTLRDGWTAVTADGLLSAQFEHTLLITANGVEVATQI